MRRYNVAKTLLGRLLLPLSLIAAVLLRQNLISLVYFILLIIGPLVKPVPLSFSGGFKGYTIAILFFSALACLAHLVFQLYLFITSIVNAEPYGTPLGNCTEEVKWFSFVGLEKLPDSSHSQHSVRLLLPDAVILLLSVITVVTLRKLSSPTETLLLHRPRGFLDRFLQNFGEIVIVLFLGLAGSAIPSISSVVYVFVFFGIILHWALRREFSRIPYGIFKVVMFGYTVVHMLILYCFQLTLLQPCLDQDTDSYWSRMFGIYSMVEYNCTNPAVIHLLALPWPYCLNPGILFLLFLSISLDFAYKRKQLISPREPPGGYGTVPSTSQAPNPDANLTNIEQPQDEPDSQQELGVKFTDSRTWKIFTSWFLRQSYLLCLFVMLLWSVLYPSWLSFAFLLASCILFLIPSTYKASLLFSPVIVIYGVLLTLLQYTMSINDGGIMYNDTLWFNLSNVDYEITSIGLQGYDYPFAAIAPKLAFTAVFCILLNQLVKARQRAQKYRRDNRDDSEMIRFDSDESTVEGGSSKAEHPTLDKVGGVLRKWLKKYWILAFSICLLVMAILEPYVYRVIYMILLLFYAVTFQFSFKWWRYILKAFLIVVAVYSMFAILVVYILSFHEVLLKFQNKTGLSDDMLSDLGFDPGVNYQAGADGNLKLLMRLAVPAFLLITVLVQLQLVHRKFMEITKSVMKNLEAVLNEDHQTAEDLQSALVAMFRFNSTLQERRTAFGRIKNQVADKSPPLFRIIYYKFICFMDIHWYRIVCIITASVTTTEISAMGFVLLFITLLSLFFLGKPQALRVVILINQFILGVFILAKMLFQLKTIPKGLLMANCTALDSNKTYSALTNTTMDAAGWLGLRTLKDGEYLSYYIGGYIGLLVSLTMVAAFRYQQTHHRYQHPDDLPGVVFQNSNHENLDSSFVNLIKYLVDFFFYRFGVECCMFVSAIVISTRLDVFGAIYSILLLVTLLLTMVNRRFVKRFWPLYFSLLSIVLGYQYLCALGLPPALCLSYPWEDASLNLHGSEKLQSLLKLWLYFPSYSPSRSPDGSLLIGDFIQLLVVAVQWQVFLIESESSRQGQGQPSPRSTASPDEVSAAAQISEADLMPGHRPNRYRRRADWYVEYASRAGNNAGLHGKLPADWELETTMSRRDFTRDQLENWSEFLLGAVCRYWIWASVVAIFVAGTQNINLYTLVYLTFCFYLLWHGVELLKKRHENIIRLWNVILIYNCLVILVKTCLQVLSCVFLEYLLSEASSSSTDNRCIPAEMFSLKCLNPRLASDSDESESRFANCGVSVMEAGITWDIVCFFWLIIQRRIFHSSFYQILVCSYRAQFLLAAAGGKMMKKIRDAEIKKLQQQETDEVENITQRMVKIREGMEKLEKRSRRDWTHDEVIRGATASMLRRYLEDDPTSAGSQERVDTPSLPPTPPTLQAAGAGTNQLLNMFPDRRETGDGDAHPSDPDQATKDRDEADSDAGHSHPPPPQPGISILDEEIGWVKRRILFITKILRQKSRDFTIVSQRLKEIQIPVKRRVMELMLQGLAESHQYADDEQIREILCENESDLTNRETIQKLMDKHEEMMKEENEHKALWKILLAALSDSIISKTDLICYAAMVLCYLEYGSLMSLVLPILAVMWGMLSLPRPAKIFWITVLTYTMGMILVKSFFQLKVFPWSPTTINKWYDWRLILGISNEKINRCSVDDMHCKVEEDYTYYVFFELFLLLWVCFHRSLLRTYGLWRDEKFRIDDVERVDEPLDRESCDLKHSHDAMSGQPAAADDSSGSERASGRGSPVGVSKKNGTLSRNPKRMGSHLFNDWWKALNTGSMFPKGDYYAWMFLCDFINFLITVVAYNNFGPQYGNVQDYIQESRIPVPFLILLLVQFILLFIDRAIYLKKSRVGRLVFHIFLVVVVHIWMFLVLPIYTNLAFVENNGAKAWYFFKCVYFGLSAWQIKSGYPSQVSGNFLTSQYGIINWILLKAFLLVPFLLEIRVVMDWMLTKTSLSLPSWFTMEDIFAKMFLIKCLREYEKNNPSERGDKARRPVVKYTIGILLIVALVLVIWFPLLLFSIGYQVYLPNPPVECEATVSIGGFQDVFKTRTQPSQIDQVTADQLSKFREANIKSATATGFLDTYGNTDITTIQLDGSSLAVWGIAPPNEAALLKSLNSSDFMMVTTKLLFTRLSKQGLTASSLSASYRYELKVNSTQRKKLYEMLASKISQKPIELPSFLPRYIRLPNTGLPQTVSALQCFPVCTQTRLDVGGMPRHGMTLQLQKSAQNVTRNESPNLLGQAEWWNVGETSNYTQTFNTRKTNKQSYTGLFFVTFSDKIAPDSFKFLAGPGIIGLYVTLVFAVGRILRPIFSDQTYTLMFQQLPYVDRVFKMCEDIYIVRGSRDLVQLQNSESCLKLEEDLFALLIFLFRSPEILIQYTDLKAKEKTD